ncbi:efflux RND transporter periplasmic adaptor subunit [Yoonia litorea]|uniref:RND family efflux transporter, MFP subunit n=1 Tax=Yoonia litorea TaxID=1123755 RepID=A0A1I6N3R5_9RHOB|nr:HlyD family efflux transporter periplasmic adaptor subunit [Yoonia litorea]SFS22527.1 RND family efflux transporter, MFP subunit [Yoonia litorea]
MNKSESFGADGIVGDVFLDAESFAHLKHGDDVSDSVAALLQVLSRLNPEFEQIVLVLSDGPTAKLQPAGVWPKGATPVRAVLAAVQGAAKGNRLVMENAGDGLTGIAIPISVDGRLSGIAGVLLRDTDDSKLRNAIDQIQWASGWIEALLRRKKLTDSESLSNVIELLATSLHHSRFQEATTAVASELATVLGCERVAVGFVKGHRCKVRALSNSATFHKRAGLINLIQMAMEEAIDQQTTVAYPERETANARVVRAQQALARDQDSAAVASIPLAEGKRVIGAITLEKATDGPFEPGILQKAEYAAALLGPVLDVKRREDRWLITKAWDSFKGVLGNLIGPRHWGLKLGTAAVILFALFCYYATGDYRVTAQTVIEGKIQRSVTVPLAGFLTEAPVRAGDIIEEGQIIARLDDRDLRLERLKWASQRSQQEREYSQAIASRQRTEARILEAQIAQADAQIELLDSQLERMTIRAPFSGIIVSGDLSQALGAPLERGDVIFEVAPLSDFRVMLRVDERDIADIEPGQEGNLVLSAFPDADVTLEVVRITPISTAAEGENFFVVEAELLSAPDVELRPGMEGVAKVNIREERLITIWTKRTWLWLRMTAWKWWP